MCSVFCNRLYVHVATYMCSVFYNRLIVCTCNYIYVRFIVTVHVTTYMCSVFCKGNNSIIELICLKSMKISDHVLKLYNRQCQLSIIFGEISRHPFNRASRRQLLSKVGASDCCLTPTQQICSTLSWQEQVNFQ